MFVRDRDIVLTVGKMVKISCDLLYHKDQNKGVHKGQIFVLRQVNHEVFTIYLSCRL